MAIATLADYKAALAAPHQIAPIAVGATTMLAGRMYDLWRTTTPVGAVPTSAENPDYTTLGALPLDVHTGVDMQITGARFSSLAPGQYIICDRLAQMGGLSGTVTTAQPVSVSNPARGPAYGIGVIMGLTIYTQIGTTGTTVTLGYNDSNSSYVTSPAVVIGGTGFREANRFIQIPNDPAGAPGVLYVNDCTVLASTGTAGNFGVTLLQPLFALLVPDASGVTSAAGLISGSTFGGIPQIPYGACLCALAISQSTNAAGAGAVFLEET